MSAYIQSFLLGGSIIALAKYVSQYFNPLYASIIGGFPTGIITSFFILQAAHEGYFHSYAYHSTLLAFTIICIYLLNTYTSFNPYLIAGVGITLWLIISLLIVKFYLMPSSN